MTSRRASPEVRAGKHSRVAEAAPVPPTPPTPAGQAPTAQPQQTNSTTTPAATTGTQSAKPPVSSAQMGQAAKLADKIAGQPGIEKRSTLNQRVQQLAGTVGASATQSPMMSDLVSAELINQGSLDPKKVTEDEIEEDMITKKERNELRSLRTKPTDQRSREEIARLATLRRKDTPPHQSSKKVNERVSFDGRDAKMSMTFENMIEALGMNEGYSNIVARDLEQKGAWTRPAHAMSPLRKWTPAMWQQLNQKCQPYFAVNFDGNNLTIKDLT